MERAIIEAVRARVSCAAVLLAVGFILDKRESSRRALKFRRAGEILIVTHDGAGWFDPLSERKGDVFTLVRLLEKVSFAEALERLGELNGPVGVTLPDAATAARRRSVVPIGRQWAKRPGLMPGSPASRYLSHERALPGPVIRQATWRDLVREGPFGSAWFAHRDEAGQLTGWEERGPQWRGFSGGGRKTLFMIGSRRPLRFCITEAAIDALSLAALEAGRTDTLYASTGGGWSPSTARLIRTIAGSAVLVAATDADPQGEAYADRLRHMAGSTGCDFVRLKPAGLDWNEDLKERREGEEVAHARATASRVKLRPPDGGP